MEGFGEEGDGKECDENFGKSVHGIFQFFYL